LFVILVRRIRISVLYLPLTRVRAQQKGPLAVCASAGLFESWCAFLLFRRTGHCRQHALRMVMVVPAMLDRKAHL